VEAELAGLEDNDGKVLKGQNNSHVKIKIPCLHKCQCISTYDFFSDGSFKYDYKTKKFGEGDHKI